MRMNPKYGLPANEWLENINENVKYQEIRENIHEHKQKYMEIHGNA